MEDVLQPDGTIDLDRARGSIDTHGWRMTLESDGAPRFVPAEASSPSSSAAVAGEYWDDRFVQPGVFGNSVRALIVDEGGTLFIGGVFTTAGGLQANRIVQWFRVVHIGHRNE
jgi:hypothetical protein